MANKIFVRGSWVELNSKTFGIGLITLGIIMMFLTQTKSIGPMIIGFGIGVTLSGLRQG